MSLAFGTANDHPRPWQTKRPPIFIPALDSWLVDNTKIFYLKINLKTRQTRVFVCQYDFQDGLSKFFRCCAGPERLDVKADPFVFFCCAFSTVIESWVLEDAPIAPFIRSKVRPLSRIKQMTTPPNQL